MGPAGGMLPLTSSWPSEGLKTLMAFYAPPGPSREKMQAIIEALMYNPGKVDPEVLEERYQAAIDPDAMATAMAVFKAVQSGEPVLVAEELWRDVHRITNRTLLDLGPRRPGPPARLGPVHDPLHARRPAPRVPQLRPLGPGRARRRVPAAGHRLPVRTLTASHWAERRPG